MVMKHGASYTKRSAYLIVITVDFHSKERDSVRERDYLIFHIKRISKL